MSPACRRPLASLLVSVALLLPGSGCEPGPSPEDAADGTGVRVPSGDVRAALAAQRRVLEEGVRRNDAAAMASVYAEDALMLDPDVGPVRGRDAIEESFRRARRDYEIRHETLEVEVRGDWAHETGLWSAHGLDDGTVRESGAYAWLWKRGSGGAWRILREVYSYGRQRP